MEKKKGFWTSRDKQPQIVTEDYILFSTKRDIKKYYFNAQHLKKIECPKVKGSKIKIKVEGTVVFYTFSPSEYFLIKLPPKQIIHQNFGPELDGVSQNKFRLKFRPKG